MDPQHHAKFQEGRMEGCTDPILRDPSGQGQGSKKEKKKKFFIKITRDFSSNATKSAANCGFGYRY